jgi:hypothetical protein
MSIGRKPKFCRGAFKMTPEHFSGKDKTGLPLENAPFMMVTRGLIAKPVPTFADHAPPFREQCRCVGINRAAQNGSRTALKMLTFAAMRCS